MWYVQYQDLDLTLPGVNRAEGGEQSKPASLWGPLATVVQIVQTYRSTSVNIVILVWALVYPGLLTTPLLVVGLLTAQMRPSTVHSREHTVTRQAPRELHQIHRRRVPISTPHVRTCLHPCRLPYSHRCLVQFGVYRARGAMIWLYAQDPGTVK